MEENKSQESHLRSILKGITWRILATATTVSITYALTGKIDLAIQVSALEFILKLLIYYLHERAWQQVPRGTIRKIFRR